MQSHAVIYRHYVGSYPWAVFERYQIEQEKVQARKE